MSNRRSMLLMTGAHSLLVRLTRGLLGWRIGALPVIELGTRGRRSGEWRTAMLTTPVVETVGDVERLIIIASRGGDDAPPAWYLNLTAHPNVTVRRRHGEALPYRASTASAQERARLWPLAVQAYAGYAAYQRKTEREIPVVVLEPIAAPA